MRLTSCTRRQASRSVSRIESSSGGEMPALLKAMSTPAVPVDGRREHRGRRHPRSSTSVRTKRPVHLRREALADLVREVGDDHGGALLREPPDRRQADAGAAAGDHRDLALEPACHACSFLGFRADEDVLDLGERVERVRAELAADAARLEPAERRRVAHRASGELTERLPASTPRATRMARPTSRVQIEPDSPYAVSFALATASASSSKAMTATTGPKTSSRQTRSCVPLGRTTVGGTTSRLPRERSRGTPRRPGAPTGLRLLDEAAHGIPLARRGRGPIWVASSPGSPTTTSLRRALEALHERVEHAALHQDPGARAAVLTGVVEEAVGADAAAVSRSASANTMLADLPPTRA